MRRARESRTDRAPRAAGLARALTVTGLAASAWVYVGYPATVTAAAAAAAAIRQRRAARPTDPATDASPVRPTCSVVVAAHQEAGTIAARIADLRAQDPPPGEILVVDDASTDGTGRAVEEAAAGDPRVRLLRNPTRGGKRAALNLGFEHARGEIVVVTDANNRFAPGSLAALLDAFAVPAVGAATGAKRVVAGPGGLAEAESAYWRYEDRIKRAESAIGSCTGAEGGILAVRRDLFEPLPPRTAVDDLAIVLGVLRRGARVVYIPGAVLEETSAASEEDELERRRRIAAGRWQLFSMTRALPLGRPVVMAQLVSHKFMRLLLPLFMAAALGGNAAATLLGRRRADRVLLAGQLAFYASAALPRPARDAPRWRRLLYVPRYVVRSQLAVLGGLGRHLRGEDHSAWTRVGRHPDGEPPG